MALFANLAKSQGAACCGLEAPSLVAENKFTAWLINVKDDKILAEYYGPNDGQNGICHYYGSKSAECTFEAFVAQVNRLLKNRLRNTTTRIALAASRRRHR
jgi:hypothetical protein